MMPVTDDYTRARPESRTVRIRLRQPGLSLRLESLVRFCWRLVRYY